MTLTNQITPFIEHMGAGIGHRSHVSHISPNSLCNFCAGVSLNIHSLIGYRLFITIKTTISCVYLFLTPNSRSVFCAGVSLNIHSLIGYRVFITIKTTISCVYLFLTPNSRSVFCAGVSLNIHSFIHSFILLKQIFEGTQTEHKKTHK